MIKININKIDQERLNSGAVHFCGIGGIGMSAIAQVMHHMGIKVQGSDIASQNSYTIQNLLSLGIKVFPEHKASSVENASYVVYSTAVNDSNPEIIHAKEKQIPIVHRSDALAYIMENYIGIAICGSHGKTTTTALVGYILDECGFDPVIIGGGVMNNYNTNYKTGKGKYIVVEADESDGSFIKLKPHISLITNIDREHMENYGSMKAIEGAFKTIAQNSEKLIACYDDQRLKKISLDAGNSLGYGASGDNLFCVVDVLSAKWESGFSSFKIYLEGQEYTVKTKLCGVHNFLNIAGAILLARQLGSPIERILGAVKNFNGVKRRFTIVGTLDEAIVVDDYAHHPTEIKAVLSAARSFLNNSNKGGRVISVFQPHRYSRLHDLFNEFSQSFGEVEGLIITDIYSAGEANPYGVNVEDLALKIQEFNPDIRIVVAPLSRVHDNLKLMHISKEDLVVFMGAGDITKFAYSVCDVLF